MQEVQYVNRANKPDLAYIKTDGDPGKPTVIYAHGFCLSMQMDKPKKVHDHFTKKGHTFIRFDFTDHGASTWPKEKGVDPNTQKKLEFRQWIMDLKMIMKKFADEPVIFVGDSMGAWIGLLVALDNPEKFLGFVIMSCGVDFIQRFNDSFFLPNDKEKMENGEVLWVKGPYGDYVGSAKLAKDSKEYELLTKEKIPLKCPFRFVHRVGDVVIPYERVFELIKKLESKDVTVFMRKGGDHRMVFKEDYEAMLNAVDSLLRALDNKDEVNGSEQ